ncbi:hypothetical protein BSLG_001935 [Batrachochytrium salamandrivorans]|nr:hypothetical protein BSLG_001935 [Batrachochytrium salamandrivorans]
MHVTFFFNGGTEAQYDGEDRELIASPKVATYDMKPEMSAIEVAEVAQVVDTSKYSFVMCNFAPPDMVGYRHRIRAILYHLLLASDVFQFDAGGVDMRAGALCDVAPTILEVMGVPTPAEMTGRSLLKH